MVSHLKESLLFLSVRVNMYYNQRVHILTQVKRNAIYFKSQIKLEKNM